MTKITKEISGYDPLMLENQFMDVFFYEMYKKNIQWNKGGDDVADSIPDGVEMSVSVTLKKIKKQEGE